MIGLIGKKLGMTRVFDEDGVAVAVTVIDVSDNRFLKKCTQETDGYSAVQVGYDEQKESRLNMPDVGQFKKYGSSPKRFVREFRLENDEQIPDVDGPTMNIFEEGQLIDVIGTSKGKGFQGVMKRYNFHGQPAAHGHMMHRRTGGIGAGTDPGRVAKNKKMPGRHGSYKKTIQNLKVVAKRPEDNVILVSGAVPGTKGSYVMVRPAIKSTHPAQNFSAPAAEAEKPAEEAAE